MKNSWHTRSRVWSRGGEDGEAKTIREKLHGLIEGYEGKCLLLASVLLLLRAIDAILGSKSFPSATVIPL